MILFILIKLFIKYIVYKVQKEDKGHVINFLSHIFCLPFPSYNNI